MKTRYLFNFGLLLFVCALFMPESAAQTTTFTYQGKLNDSSIAANGNYDFQFALFGGSPLAQVGPTLTRTSVPVTNGIFTVQLDFATGSGTPFQTGGDLFLQISVKRSADVSYTLLSPSQQIYSSPYSIRAASSANADTATNSTQLGGLPAIQYVLTSDARMADSRTPLPGSASYIQNTSSPQAAANFNISGTGMASIFNAAGQYNLLGNRVFTADGSGNTFVGFNTTFANSGSNNTFAGNQAGAVNTSGFSNSFFGERAGAGNSGGVQNSFFGVNAGSANTTGNGNSFYGESSGANNKANANTFFGNGSGFSNTNGIENSFFGFQAGNSNVIGSQNSFFGFQSGVGNTGDGNSFFGDRTGQSNATGHDNDFYGSSAGAANTTGVFNSFFGSGAGSSNTTSSNNSFFGADAGNKNTGGSSNAFFGSGSGFANTNGLANSFFGINAGIGNTTGSANTFVGQNAGANNLTGANNTFLGAGAGNLLLNTGAETGNTMLGEATGYSSGVTNSTAIGIRAAATASHTINLGTSSETTVVWGNLFMNAVGTAGGNALCLNFQNIVAFCSSSLRYKKDLTPFTGGLDLVKRFQPISFTWKDGGVKDIGLGAEDVAKVEPRLITYNQKGEVEGVKYDRIVVVLLNAVKEQQVQIVTEQQKLARDESLIKLQKEQFAKQQAKIEALRKLVCSKHSRARVCKEMK